MKEKGIWGEILNFGCGTVRYFSKNVKKIFEEIKKEGERTKPLDLSKVREIPRSGIKKFIKNLGFVTKEEIKKEK